MTLIYAAVASFGLVALASITLVADGRARDNSLDADVRGLGVAAGLLVVVQDGQLVTGGLTDDLVYERIDAAAVYQPGPPPVSAPIKRELDGAAMARAAWGDPSEMGSEIEETIIEGRPARAVAMPFYSDDDGRVAGAVVVARRIPEETLAGRRMLVLVVVLTAAGLALASTASGWVYAGRQTRRLGGALDQQEAFLSLAAHELRTPIGRTRAVAESARLLALQDRGGGSRRELVGELDRLVAITMDASDNISDLLLLGRIGADRYGRRFAPVRLDEIVGPLEDVVPGTVVHTPGAVTVHGDAVLLRHLVQNLVGNARRHGHHEGSPRPPSIDVGLDVVPGTDGRPWVELSVADDGPGFPPELLDSAFERFTGGGRGTGLGLWIVLWIAEFHGGTAAVSNRPMGGARVHVRLPVASGRTLFAFGDDTRRGLAPARVAGAPRPGAARL
jgi:two-component system OmpR family sensor kinase